MIVVDIKHRGQTPDVVDEFAASLEGGQYHPDHRVDDDEGEEEQGAVVEKRNQIRTPVDAFRL